MWTTGAGPNLDGSPAVSNGVLYIEDGPLLAFRRSGIGGLHRNPV